MKDSDLENFERLRAVFAKRLGEALDQRGRGARKGLADAAGRSQSWVNNLLDRGALESWWDLRVIADEMQKSADYLLGLTDDPTPRRSPMDSPRARLQRLDPREVVAVALIRAAVNSLHDTIAKADLEKIGIEVDRDKPNGALTELLHLANLLPGSKEEEDG